MNILRSLFNTKVHFLHIGKTGGTAIADALKQSLHTDKYTIKIHSHKIKLSDIPKGQKVIFFLRDPISRFISAFYSRQRRGQPRYYYEWNSFEEKAFSLFSTPNELAYSLSDPNNPNYLDAVVAMEKIQHINSHYYDWFNSLDYFKSRLADILFIGFQETLDQDFESLKTTLHLPGHLSLARDDIGAHRNPDYLDKHIGDSAFRALNEWYRDDFEFIEFCKNLVAIRNQ